jgi:ABC-2 type transport system ATP-binding protein
MIEILNVKKHYGKIEALKGVSFSISEGTCFGLIGPNGAGKSTMMKILSGILQDYEGDVHLFNQNAKSVMSLKISFLMKHYRQKITYLFSDHCMD